MDGETDSRMDTSTAGQLEGGEAVNKAQNSLAHSLRESFHFWSDFVDRCIRQRLDTDRFETLVRLVQTEHPLPPVAIADLFLRPQPDSCYSLDPRVPPYLQVLNDLSYIDAPAILKALYKYSSSHNLVDTQGQSSNGNAIKSDDNKDGKGNKDSNGDNDGSGKEDKNKTTGQNGEDEDKKTLRWKSSYWVEEVMFFRLCKSVHEGQAVRDVTTALEVVKIISKWLALFTQASTAFAADLLGQVHNLQLEMESARAAFVPLLLRLTDNPALLKAIARPVAKRARKELSENLANFVPTLQLVNAGTAKPITEKLDFFRTEVLARLDPVDEKKQAADDAMNEMIDSAVGPDAFEVRELPIITTRVGMYTHLNAALTGRPLVDDASFFNYINNRYRGDNQSAAIDLILSSFDVLANAVFQNGGKEDAQLLKSFLINKVPLLLCQLLPPGFSNPAEACITNALNQVNTSMFPTASLMFDESRSPNNPYTESVREEFCAACVMHGLVNREHMETILGEMSMSYQPEKKSKDKLVQDYHSHTIKGQDLLSDLEKTDGNVGAVCHALVEIIRKLCQDKDTMSLKLLCVEIVQKPQMLDTLLLFETLHSILGPLCQLLDNWKYDEDQNEYQPVYEEFGAILLLVLAFTNRYALKPSDIGLYSPKSSVRKIINQAHVNRSKEKLSEQEDKHLNGWILGLFDSEGGGLGDDLMSSCPPQDFYLLVAPLFYQIVVGYSHGYINDDTLKGGVEYLVDTFLLPSLVPAIQFLTDYLWVDQKEQKAIIKILQLILTPSAISNEASAMLASVKKIVARPLDNALQTYVNKREPNSTEVTPLINAIKDSIPNSRRTGYASTGEISEWCKAEPRWLWTTLRNTTQSLMQWSMQPGMNAFPITYTHRQYTTAARLMGPQAVLKLIFEELRLQSRAGEPDPANQNQNNAAVVTDVAMALVCAPDPTNEPPAPSIDSPPLSQPPPPLQRLLGLREVLKLEAERCREIQKTDPILAEIVVRLYRRVEAQMTPALAPPAPDMLAAADMPDMGAMPGMEGMDGMQGIGDMGGAGADVSLDAAMADMQGDGSGGVGFDMSLDGLGGVSGTGDVGGDDLFGGLDANIEMDDLDWGDGMDLT